MRLFGKTLLCTTFVLGLAACAWFIHGGTGQGDGPTSNAAGLITSAQAAVPAARTTTVPLPAPPPLPRATPQPAVPDPFVGGPPNPPIVAPKVVVPPSPPPEVTVSAMPAALATSTALPVYNRDRFGNIKVPYHGPQGRYTGYIANMATGQVTALITDTRGRCGSVRVGDDAFGGQVYAIEPDRLTVRDAEGSQYRFRLGNQSTAPLP